MEMNRTSLELKRSIDESVRRRDGLAIEKNVSLVLQQLLTNLCESYPNHIRNVKSVDVVFIHESDVLFSNEYLGQLKEAVAMSHEMAARAISPAQAKFFLDKWFYHITVQGELVYEYVPGSLLPLGEVATRLGVSTDDVVQYVDRGLDAVCVEGELKVPALIVDAWRNPAIAFEMQWVHQMLRNRGRSLQDQLSDVNRCIGEFERQYGGTFQELFGTLGEDEIDRLDEAVDISDWCELEAMKVRLVALMGEENTTSSDEKPSSEK